MSIDPDILRALKDSVVLYQRIADKNESHKDLFLRNIEHNKRLIEKMEGADKTGSISGSRAWRYEELSGLFQKLNTPPMLVFPHIMKTAGTTFATILSKIYHRKYYLGDVLDNKDLAEWISPSSLSFLLTQKDLPRFLMGHFTMDHDLFNFLPDQYLCVTFLREPIARAYSFYNWLVKNKEDVTLIPYVEQSQNIGFDNMQVRTLVRNGQDIPFGHVTGAHLEEAKRALVDRITFFGLSEEFDTSLIIMASLFGWTDFYYTPRKKMRYKNPARDEDKAFLEKLNQFDVQLYEFAREVFQRRVAPFGEQLERRRALFQKQNKAYEQMIGSTLDRKHPWALQYFI